MLVKARYMRAEKFQNQSLHYVNSYAVQSRIHHNHLPNVYPDSCTNSPVVNAKLLLPSLDDDKSIRKLFMTHISRILCSNMKFFELSFDGVVEHHIEHQYSKEMSTKSHVVSIVLGAFIVAMFVCERYPLVFY